MNANNTIRHIFHESTMIALIIPGDYRDSGIKFFTPKEFSQQLGYMNRPAGYTIQPHIHNEIHREVTLTQEVLIVKSGRVEIDFYSSNQEYLESVQLVAGDIILLAAGGHGLNFLEESEIIEVKQGPHAGEEDKTRFAAKRDVGVGT